MDKGKLFFCLTFLIALALTVLTYLTVCGNKGSMSACTRESICFNKGEMK